MIFVYRKWNRFCRDLKIKSTMSIPAKEVANNSNSFLVLKHDVETNVKKALKMARIEAKYGHRGSYYVQAYLMNNAKNIKMLQKMKEMGHEVSYHYDVMDFARGNIETAKKEFEKNKLIFENNNFEIITVCQHGNPLIERIGYTSNRDFFRNKDVQALYPNISDIMVNYKSFKSVNYLYFSDAGRKFKLVYDPLFNDVVNSDDKNVAYDDLDALENAINSTDCSIVSTHPHRWCSSSLIYIIKAAVFYVMKFVAKLLYKIPFMRKFISKHYQLAKKI